MIDITKVNKGECHSCLSSTYGEDVSELFEIRVYAHISQAYVYRLCRSCCVKLRHELNWIL